MTLPEELWGALGLAPAIVVERARFLAAYAEFDEPWPTTRDLIQLTAGGQPFSGSSAVVDLSDEYSDEARDIRQSIDLARAAPTALWARMGERATAWCDCAMAQLMIDDGDGRQTLLQSASLYRELGLPFGDFLVTVVTGSRDAAGVATRQLLELFAGYREEPEVDRGQFGEPVHRDRLISWRNVSGSPMQQVCILLTAASDPDLTETAPQLIEVLQRAPQARGITPVGTTGQPIALWWAAGLG